MSPRICIRLKFPNLSYIKLIEVKLRRLHFMRSYELAFLYQIIFVVDVPIAQGSNVSSSEELVVSSMCEMDSRPGSVQVFTGTL